MLTRISCGRLSQARLHGRGRPASSRTLAPISARAAMSRHRGRGLLCPAPGRVGRSRYSWARSPACRLAPLTCWRLAERLRAVAPRSSGQPDRADARCARACRYGAGRAGPAVRLSGAPELDARLAARCRATARCCGSRARLRGLPMWHSRRPPSACPPRPRRISTCCPRGRRAAYRRGAETRSAPASPAELLQAGVADGLLDERHAVAGRIAATAMNENLYAHIEAAAPPDGDTVLDHRAGRTLLQLARHAGRHRALCGVAGALGSEAG